jgi:vacuolar iron transporter family protein
MRATYFRNFIFGVEDSLVSTVGLLSGIAIAGIERETIFLTGVILIFVEAFSMGAGSFLSEASAGEYAAERRIPEKNSVIAGMVMFCSYFVAGFIPLFPYLVIDGNQALITSVLLSVVALFILGAISGAITRTRIIRSAFRMAIVGGMAIAVGVSVGSLLG